MDALTGQPFTDAGGAACVQGNIIRPGCISPVAKSLLPLIPESPTGRYTVLSPGSSERRYVYQPRRLESHRAA